MSTAPLSEDEQRTIDSLKEVFENAYGSLDGDDPPEGAAVDLDKFFLVQDKFDQTNGSYPALLNNVVAVLKMARDSIADNEGKLETWRSALYTVLQPYLMDGPDTCQAYARNGNYCSVRLLGPQHKLSGCCSRHANCDLLSAVAFGMSCATKAPCLCCGEGMTGLDTMHCIGCSRLIHASCLNNWFAEICPSRASLFNLERDSVVCANCLWRRWPLVVLCWNLERLQDPQVRLLVLPEGACEVVEKSTYRAETYEKFAAMARVNKVFPGVVALLPDRRPAGGGTPARGVRRGGASAREGGGRKARKELFKTPPTSDDDTDGASGLEEPDGAGPAEGDPQFRRLLEEMRGAQPRAGGKARRGSRQGRVGLLNDNLPAGRSWEAAAEAAAAKAAAKAVRQILGPAVANFHQPDEGALRGARDGEAVLSGEFIGVKDGEVGAANCPEICWRETYEGDGLGSVYARVVQAVMGQHCKNIADDQTQKGGPDYSSKKQFTWDFDLGALVEYSDTKGKIPPHTTAVAWWTGRHAQLQAARDCNRGVMVQTDPQFLPQYQRISLAMARYRFLGVLAEVFMTDYKRPWPVVWRYICYLVRRRWQAAGRVITVDDRALVEAATHLDYRAHMISLIKVDMVLLEEADRMARGKAMAEPGDLAGPSAVSLLKQLIDLQQGKAGGGDRKPAKNKAPDREKPLPDKCALCGSKDHVYCEGHYDHPPSAPITNRCPRREFGKTGPQCVLKHAYTGELKSPCKFSED